MNEFIIDIEVGVVSCNPEFPVVKLDLVFLDIYCYEPPLIYRLIFNFLGGDFNEEVGIFLFDDVLGGDLLGMRPFGDIPFTCPVLLIGLLPLIKVVF